jgi:hypothetical protein
MTAVNDWAMKQLIGNLRVKADPFGIYESRRNLARVVTCQVYRGDEWWTAAADKIIQGEIA